MPSSPGAITSLNDRTAFLAALTSTLIDDNVDQFDGADVDFDNTTVNTATFGPTLSGFDVSHSGDESTTQFVNGSDTNATNTGNFTPDIQFLLDLAGVTGAFGSFSNQADTGTITIQTAGVNAFGFDPFGFNDQGLSYLVDPQALGVEMGVLTTVTDTLGNSTEYTIAASDPFFGVISPIPIDTIVFSAVPTFASSGTEFISIDNFVGGIGVAANDQRGDGFDRIVGGTVDIGAYEQQPFDFSSADSATVTENTQPVLSLTVVDGGLSPTFSVAGSGADNSQFEIVSGNQLQFIAPPDFENPTDVGGDNVYQVTVQADDGSGGIGTQTIQVRVTPVNDNSPLFTSPDAVNHTEIETSVVTLVATDADLPAQAVGYRLLGQAPVGELGPGESLAVAETIQSPDGAASLVMQGDGNLVVYIAGNATWASATNPAANATTTIEPDGNLVITDGGGGTLYQSGSGGNAGALARLRVDNAGFPEIVRVDGEILWRGTLGNTGGGGTVFSPPPLAPEFTKAADTDLFQISGSDELQFIASPDFESPTDANSDNVYEVSVLADDGNGRVTPQTILVTVTNVLEPNDADFVDDNSINGADFLAWQRGFGTSSGATQADGDADSDGDVDADDLAAWEAVYGQTVAPLAAASSNSSTESFAELAPSDQPETVSYSALVDAAIALDALSTVHQEALSLLVAEEIALEYIVVGSEPQGPLSTAGSESVVESIVTRKEGEAAAEYTWLDDQLLESLFGE